MREDLDRADAWEDEFEGTGSLDSIEDLFDLFEEDYAETDTDEADQPQFDIVYQLRQVLDPPGTRSSQEANIRDGHHNWPYGSSRAPEGPRVDLSYRTPLGARMNLEVDLDTPSQQQHRLVHEAAMQRAYNQWVIGGRIGANPLDNVASIFVTASHPGQQGRDRQGNPNPNITIRVGTITAVRRVQYRVGPGQRVSGVTTGLLRPTSARSVRQIAQDPIFRELLPLPPQAPPAHSPRTTAAFDAFWDAFADEAFAY